jgi:hypothetical protein
MRERGAASLLLLGVAAVGLLFAVALADAARFVSIHFEASAAADAAALAAAPVTFRPFGAAGTPREEAARFAAANSARLVSCDCALDRSWAARTVEVVVARRVDLMLFGSRSILASARAEFAPAALLGPGGE